MTAKASEIRSEPVFGLIYAASAFLIWGLSPLYWKALGAVPALEIIAHRVVWSFLFLMGLILLQRRWSEFAEILKSGRMLLTLMLTAILVSKLALIYLGGKQQSYAAGKPRVLH